MGARFDRLRCEVFQNLFLSPMNTGFVRPAVATVLTVYGIETDLLNNKDRVLAMTVATVLTVYGIETFFHHYPVDGGILLQQYLPFTVLKRQNIQKTQLIQTQSCNSTYRLRY